MEDIIAAFRRKAKEAHPDAGGTAEMFRKLVEARGRLLAALGTGAPPPKPPDYAPKGVQVVYRVGSRRPADRLGDNAAAAASLSAINAAARSCCPSPPRRRRSMTRRPPLRSNRSRAAPGAAARRACRQSPNCAFVFATERGGPFTSDAINRLVKRIGALARFAFPIHAHMLRHACGYALAANAGHDTRRIQDWLGHRSIQHTTRYTQLSAAPFKDF